MRKCYQLRIANGGSLELGKRTLIVGVLNVTPDSFSDGGVYSDTGLAVERAMEMVDQGVDIIEVGGESTRPDAVSISVEEELNRVIPVVASIAKKVTVPISVDTYKGSVARAALDAGAGIINDVYALRHDTEVAQEAARSGAGLVLMHMRGDPGTMQKIEPARDIFKDIETEIGKAMRLAEDFGVCREQIIIDPGIGFGKTLEQNLEILNHLDRLSHFDVPIMIGTSRKSFIGRITGKPVNERIFGTAASVALALARGAHMVRVHDIGEMVEVVRITDAILAS